MNTNDIDSLVNTEPSLLESETSEAPSASTSTSSSHQTSKNAVQKPNFVDVTDTTSNTINNYSPVIDVTSSEFDPIPTLFKLYDNSEKTEIEPTAANLMDHFWSINIVKSIVENSNLYIKKRKEKEPTLLLWKDKNMHFNQDFTIAETYQFLAIIYYMGLVKLPAKTDYWSIDPIMPFHPVCNDLGMIRDRFEFLFCHFHCNSVTDEDLEIEEEGERDENSEEEIIAMDLERVQHEQDNDTREDKDDEDYNKQKKVWYTKVQPLVNHFRNKKQTVGTYPWHHTII